MTLIPKRLIIIFVLIIAGIVLGRLAVRGFMNLYWAALCLEATYCDERKEDR